MGRGVIRDIVALSGETMGTTWTVRVGVAEGGLAETVETGIQAVLDQIIDEMSNWEPDAHISRFNRSPIGTWQPLPEAFLSVLRAGLDIAARSDGAFDPAIGRAVNHWGFGPAADPEGDAPAMGSPWRQIEISGNQARRMADISLDFCGIAKGFAVDAVADHLIAWGLRHFIVEIGGELRGVGVKPDGQPWWVDVEPPLGLALPLTRVALSNLSIATSGDYRRFFEKGGQRFAHSIDPRSGAPAANGVASVTVLHESAMMADGWATALLVAGREAGMALADQEGLAALMVVREGKGAVEHLSPRLIAMTTAG